MLDWSSLYIRRLLIWYEINVLQNPNWNRLKKRTDMSKKKCAVCVCLHVHGNGRLLGICHSFLIFFFFRRVLFILFLSSWLGDVAIKKDYRSKPTYFQFLHTNDDENRSTIYWKYSLNGTEHGLNGKVPESRFYCTIDDLKSLYFLLFPFWRH